MLVIRPNYDKATSFTHSWAQLIVDALAGVEDIADTNVVPGVIRSALPSQTSIAFFGHGTAIALLGHHGAPVISVVNAIAGHLRGKVILAVACNSAQFLGLGWIGARTGTRAYIGYTRRFRFLAGGASTFGEVATAPLLRMIVRGATAGDALEFGHNIYREAIQYYVGGQGRFHPSRPGIVARLGWNLNSLVLRGDRRVTLS